ncbi:hypothetical protein A1O3_03814 [Capronia epimyces CBS 606.96]|uniref:Uncharacterized protein n=1 Tax=Capronia epimyces CBS 606.96 TaxID=1182542 RepID=W9YB63_9EURO|nr:uncharacterized protein A1O3_03814 [Capronia epimyces CBS 606.96]EXJ86860.1 hypothetical protein A1O3_03814 [Capronia epimyces CBS 606.96]
MHWRAPTTMLATFATGAAFAVGHHFFYQSLHGTPVEMTNFDQQINFGIGTSFTFLVRSFLTMAVGTAFVQVLWRELLSEQIAVSRIDSMTQLLTSIFDLLNMKTLWQHPVLAYLAIISWTIPIAAVVPPASLSVRRVTEPRVEYITNNLPLLDFTKQTFAAVANYVSPDIGFSVCFEGGSTGLDQLAQEGAVRGQILSRTAPAPNSSYSLQFFGPSIRCQPTADTVMSSFDAVFGCNLTVTNYTDNFCGFNYSYLAWTPDPTVRVPFDTGSVTNDSLDFRHDQSTCTDLSSIGGFAQEPVMIYIGTFTDTGNWSVLNCSLYNASYTTKVDYQESVETISTTTQPLNGLPLLPVEHHAESYSDLTEAERVGMSYQAVMESFGKIMVGGIWYSGDAPWEVEVDATSVLLTSLKNCMELGGNDSMTSLAQATEQLFENITISLFSKPDYVWARLALAYGLAIFFAAVAVLIGGLALLASNQSYQYTFSTVMRVTRQRAIDAMIRPEDMNGQAPLPKHIGQARIMAGHEKSDDLGIGVGVGVATVAVAEPSQEPRQTMQETQPLARLDESRHGGGSIGDGDGDGERKDNGYDRQDVAEETETETGTETDEHRQ